MIGIDIDALKKENEDLKKANSELQQRVDELRAKVLTNYYHYSITVSMIMDYL